MAKDVLLLICGLFVVDAVLSQDYALPVQYEDSVFTQVLVKSDLRYADSTGAGNEKEDLFDFYYPGGIMAGRDRDQPGSAKPLIIWLHGGGFKFGSKDAESARFFCTSFAHRGYLCASINYRLSHKNTLTNFKNLVKGCSDAVQDVRQAVGYFKKHWKEYNVDTNYIILGGNSAGGMLALQAAYSRPGDLLALAGDTTGLRAAESYGTGGIAAVINFWGGIFNTDWLANAKVPIVSVHGSKDHIVSIGRKGNYLFGSQAIHEKADSLAIPNQLKIFNGYAHELQKHFDPFFIGEGTKGRWQEAGQFAAEFLYVVIKNPSLLKG